MKWLALALLVAAACSDDDPMHLEPLFPDNYRQSYTEVRDCRSSADHDLNRIRVLADPAALVPYRDRMDEFPPGAVLLKEEYDFADTDCEDEVVQWTVMVKLPEADSTKDNLGYTWQRVRGLDGEVIEQDPPRCAACHSACVPPDGYRSTCAVPFGGG